MSKSVLVKTLVLGAWFLCVATARPAAAVVVGSTDMTPFSVVSNPYYGLNPNYVYATNGGTSVAVGDFMMLTADHYYINTAADNDAGYTTYTINGDTWRVADVDTLAPDGIQTAIPDLRILHMENLTSPGTPLPGWYELYAADGGWPVSERDLVLVGSGDTGEDHTTYYTNTANTRDLRWATNTIDNWTRKTFTDYRGVDHSTYCMNLSYDKSGAAPDEGGLGDHDSGAPLFVNDDGVWKVAGLGVYRYEEAPAGSGNFRDFSAVSIPYYADRLNMIVPEPATLTLLAVGGLVLIRRRRL